MTANSKKIFLAILIFLTICGLLLLLSRHLKNQPSVRENPVTTTPANTPSGLPEQAIPSSSPQTTIKAPSPIPVTAATSPQSTTELLKNMHQTFDDEFNNFSRYVDSSGNVTCNPGGTGTWQTVYAFCSRTIPTNYEAEVYIDQSFLSYLNSNVKVPTNTQNPFTIDGGVLNIEAAPIDSVVSAAVGNWAKYTSGLITTQFSFSQQFGYFEVRAKLPSGKGLWPAFWLLPINKQWPPEIDAMEAFGGSNPKGEGGSTMIHYQSILTDQTKSCGNWHDVKQDITKAFHSYGVDIEKNGITYYFDGQAYAQCPPNPEVTQPFYMLVDLAVGSSQSWPGSPDASNSWPQFLNVDYVRAYQNN